MSVKSDPFVRCPLCGASFKGLGAHIQSGHSKEFKLLLDYLAMRTKINGLNKEVDRLFV